MISNRIHGYSPDTVAHMLLLRVFAEHGDTDHLLQFQILSFFNTKHSPNTIVGKV